MKRLRCRLSPRDQFLPPAPTRRFHPHHLHPRSQSTTTTTPDPPTLLPPCRDPLRSSKLAALHARLSLHPTFPLQTLARALIHPTADPSPHFNNGPLSTLGSTLIDYYASEYFLCTYPRLPTRVLGAATAAFVGSKPLAAVGREWGVESAFEPKADVDAGLLQFKRLPPGGGDGGGGDGGGVSEEEAMGGFVKGTFAGVYLHEGVRACRHFFRQHVLSRGLDVDRLFDFVQPTRELSRLCAREGFEPPVARWESETGRRSVAPVFVVGVYSGLDKIGEGHGGSLDEARIRAAVHALKGWYLYRPPAGGVDLPSKTDGDPAASFKPAVIDVGEVIV